MLESQPLVSLILVVRNGMPYVQEAIASVRALSYPNYELIVQDGASTDGTLEYLRSITDLPAISLVSESDSGIGQAYNRAVQRCRGEIVGSIDADNLLKADVLDAVVQRFAEHPGAAVIYGACDMISEDGALLHRWVPPAFDLLGLMEGAVVPPFGQSFFSRRLCGGDLSFDERFQTVADFDLWLRLSHHKIVRVFDVFGAVRVGAQSSTWNASNYDRQCGFKVAALRSFLEGKGREAALSQLQQRSEAGIYLWAVDSMAMLDADSSHTNRYFAKASASDLRSARFRSVTERARPTVDASNTEFVEALQGCAHEFLGNRQLAEAMVYIDVLQRSGCLTGALESALQAFDRETK